MLLQHPLLHQRKQSDTICLSHQAELTATHFGGGGGLLRKKTSGEQEEEGNQRAKSRQELIEELIQKSKQEKVFQDPDMGPRKRSL